MTGLNVLMVIAMICRTGGSTFRSSEDIQKACQKSLISCYEKSYPHKPRSKDEELQSWQGDLKDCIKNR